MSRKEMLCCRVEKERSRLTLFFILTTRASKTLNLPEEKKEGFFVKSLNKGKETEVQKRRGGFHAKMRAAKASALEKKRHRDLCGLKSTQEKKTAREKGNFIFPISKDVLRVFILTAERGGNFPTINIVKEKVNY